MGRAEVEGEVAAHTLFVTLISSYTYIQVFFFKGLLAYVVIWCFFPDIHALTQ